MDKIIIREAINFKILASIILGIVMMLLFVFSTIYVRDFRIQAGDVKAHIVVGEWDAAEEKLTLLRDYNFFSAKVLALQLDLLQAKNLAAPRTSELINIIAIANYLAAHFPAAFERQHEVLGNAYYKLGTAYYSQAQLHLEKIAARLNALDDEALRAARAQRIVVTKKLFTIAAHTGAHASTRSYLETLIALEADKFDYHIKLAKLYIAEREYQAALLILDKLLFAETTAPVLGQQAGLMLYALNTHLILPIKADFYRQFTLAKFAGNAPAIKGLFHAVAQKLAAAGIDAVFELIDALPHQPIESIRA